MNRDELIELYLGKSLSAYKIGALKGVNPSTVYGWLKKLNIPIRSKATAWESRDRAEWIKLLPTLVQTMNAQDIAEKYGTKYHTVQYHIKRAGLEGQRISAGTLAKRAALRGRYTKEELVDLYCCQKLNLQQIAARFDVNKVTVLNDMVRFGIPRRGRIEASELVWTPEKKEEARQRAVARPALKFGQRTDIERIFEEWANTNNIEVTAQFQLRENGHRYDYHINGTKTLIELDGDYWHSTEKQQLKDKQFELEAENAGYVVIRLLRSEILKDVSVLADLVW